MAPKEILIRVQFKDAFLTSLVPRLNQYEPAFVLGLLNSAYILLRLALVTNVLMAHLLKKKFILTYSLEHTLIEQDNLVPSGEDCKI